MFDTPHYRSRWTTFPPAGSPTAQLSVTLIGWQRSHAHGAGDLERHGGGPGYLAKAARHTRRLLPISSSLLVEGANSLTVKALPNGTATTSQWYLNGSVSTTRASMWPMAVCSSSPPTAMP